MGGDCIKLHVLTFKNPEVLISEPKNTEELWRDVYEYLDSCGYYSHTTKSWIENNRLIIDFDDKKRLLAVSKMTIRDMKDLHIEVKYE